jgi:addiction module HigA family antidote
MNPSAQQPPRHPGALIREILFEHLRLPLAEAAQRMGVREPELEAVLRGEAAVTADLALRLELLTGGIPDLVLAAQKHYDEWRARNRTKVDLTRREASGDRSEREGTGA